MANHAIIVAAGNSTRMGGTNKILAPIHGYPLLHHTLRVFQDSEIVDTITVVSQCSQLIELEKLKKEGNFSKIKKIIEGGKERQDSVYNGLTSLDRPEPEDIIIVHNGSNPLLKEEELAQCIEEAKIHGAAAVGFRLCDTIKKEEGGFVKTTLDRKNVWQMQTPQCAKHNIFLKAYEAAKKSNVIATDDVSLVEHIGGKVKIVPCSTHNFKVTTKQDLEDARLVMGSPPFIGLGQDSHEFSEEAEKPLVLGGYTIQGEQGLKANSDGDVILHSLFNAISSALGDRSLGVYADKMYEQGITDSKEYLSVILTKMKDRKCTLNNVSFTLEGKKPRLEQHHDQIKKMISVIVGLETGNIGLTFTTGDGLTSFGQGKGLQCWCYVSLKKQHSRRS